MHLVGCLHRCLKVTSLKRDPDYPQVEKWVRVRVQKVAYAAVPFKCSSSFTSHHAIPRRIFSVTASKVNSLCTLRGPIGRRCSSTHSYPFLYVGVSSQLGDFHSCYGQFREEKISLSLSVMETCIFRNHSRNVTNPAPNSIVKIHIHTHTHTHIYIYIYKFMWAG